MDEREGNNIFKERILKNQIKPPTRFDFKKDKWVAEFDKIKEEASTIDLKIFVAGLIINDLLSEIRSKLKELYSYAPSTTNEKLILTYLASSNRELSVAIKTASLGENSNPYNIKLNANYMRNILTLQEVSHGCIDGLQQAIRMCQQRIENKTELETSEEPMDIISFVRHETDLSQLYEVYTHVWHCIFWSDYDLYQLDEQLKLYCVQQPSSKFEFAFEVSSNRREKLSAHRIQASSDPLVQSKFLNDKYIVLKKEGKRKVASVVLVKKSDETILAKNTYWQLTAIDMLKYYPEEWLNKESEKGFAIKEILSVMRCLMLMSHILMEKFPMDDSAYSLNKILQFCPTVQINSLKSSLVTATNLSSIKVTNILHFLTFKSDRNIDLWCCPLIKKSKNEYAISVSALMSPVMTRLIERWCVQLGIDLSQKGYKYEKTVIDMLNNVLTKNKFIKSFQPATSKRIRLTSGEEEFDLLLLIDDLILVGEFKATLTADSEVMKQRISETLTYAGEQVNRKINFLKNNLEVIFQRLGWEFNSRVNYKFSKCIVNSSQVFVGYDFHNVPVVDEKVLKAYFESNTIRFMSVPDDDYKLRDIAWFELYSNFDELKDNLQTYLSYPPQLDKCKDAFEYSVVKLPPIHKDSVKILQRRLVLKDSDSIEHIEYIEQNQRFKLIKSKDYGEHMASVKCFI